MATFTAFRQTILGCARCHGEGHEDLWWEPLAHPVEDPTGNYTHWSTCPTNGQPILMRISNQVGG